ncbi:hypothetical protein [Paenibacillus sp. tmac-D7]|uniref:hypothetical protein n=1 Tax=Paenibacillus sp. tmac-D7 TaxID=2591462 RepID=UPI00114488BA|nr:hypothetical protein [Paenibacillus sp. tmac-D7]
MYGFDRLEHQLAQAASAEHLAAAIVEDVRGFREQVALDDDMTFLAVKITGLQY